MRSIIRLSVMIISAGLLTGSCGSNKDAIGKTWSRVEGGQRIMTRTVDGNYEMNMNITDVESATMFFSGDEDVSTFAYLKVTSDGYTIGRIMDGTDQVWKTVEGVGNPPWRIRILKKGNFFRFWVNDLTDWIRSPLGNWAAVPGPYDPMLSRVGVMVPEEADIQSFTLTELPWLDESIQVIGTGPAGSYYEQQVIPGGFVEWNGKYYVYFMAGMIGDEEGSSRRSIGLASSSDLITWEVMDEPVINMGDANIPHDNLYPSGATVTPDGKIALMYSVQKFPEWKGICLATADRPEGPFTHHPNNPVYDFGTHHHEFDLVQLDDDAEYRYILIFSGFTADPPSGPVGDRGYVLYSNDLVNWTVAEGNPLFNPETIDNWDASHIRPRGLNRIGDMWYLWYEGVHNWKPPVMVDKSGVDVAGIHSGWWDTVGLARSPDLVNWEYYPRNPTLAAFGISDEKFDSRWVGWPRMIIKDGMGYVFYTGGGDRVTMGLRRIAIDVLTNWDSEGGVTIDMLN